MSIDVTNNGRNFRADKCPECGSSAIVTDKMRITPAGMVCKVRCKSCGAIGEYDDTQKETSR